MTRAFFSLPVAAAMTLSAFVGLTAPANAQGGAQPQVIGAPAGAPQLSPHDAQRAAGPNLGGGFIEMLFSGAEPLDAPVARQPAARAPRAAAPVVASEPRYMPRQASVSGGRYMAPPQSTPEASGSRYFYRGAPAQESYQARPSASPRYAPPARQASVARRTVDPRFQRQTVDYASKHAPGTVVIDTSNRFLYLVQANGKALRYGVGVGREGFGWKGTQRISQKREWPDWRPPAAMLKRQPELPRHMPGGPANPLGARALYLGSTLYRIHGSNEPWTIGQAVSSGCIRMTNDDVMDLYNRVRIGTRVVVI